MHEYRALFADFDGWAYLNAARQGPLPTSALRALREAERQFANPAHLDEETRFTGADIVREKFARLIGASAASIAIGTGTGFGLGLAASTLSLGSGDEVLIGPNEYVSLPTAVLSAAKHRGFTVRRLDPHNPFFTADDVESALKPSTRTLMVSAVSYEHGYRADLEALGELCRTRGLTFVVDACQAAGSVPLNAPELGIDVLATGAYKWLLAPYGIGLAYLSERARQEMHSATPSYHSLLDFEWPRLNLRADASAFDVPQAAAPFHMWPLAASLDVVANATVGRIHEHANQLGDQLVERLPPGIAVASSLEPRHRSAIMVLELPSEEAAAHVNAALRRAKIHLTHRGRHLRVAPHLYNCEEDIERLVETLRGVQANSETEYRT